MNIRIGIWAGGDSSNDEGTIEWAGGATDYADGPFTMVLEKVEVVNENPGASYSYGDLTGAYSSIVVNDKDDANSSSSALSGSERSTGAGESVANASSTTVVASASSTKTGTSWTASASASASASATLAQASTSPALKLRVDGWQCAALGMLMVLAAVW